MEQKMLAPIGVLWKEAWALYKERWMTLAAIIAVPYALFALGGIMVTGTPSGRLVGGIVSLVGFLIILIAPVALIYAVREKVGFEDSYRKTIGFFWPVIGITVLSGLVVWGGIVLLVVPGIAMAGFLLFSNYVFVAEGKRGFAALLQSVEYVKGYWWAVFGRVLLVGLAAIPVSIVLRIILTMFLGENVGRGVASAALAIIFVPFSIAYHFKMFENLMALKPGLAGTTPAKGKGMLIAFMVFGVLGIILFFTFIAAVIGFFILHAKQSGAAQPFGAMPLNININK